MKQIKKRLKKAILTCVSIMTVFCNMTILQVKAADVNVALGAYTGYSANIQNSDGVHSVWSDNVQQILINGEVGFCIEPGLLLTPGSGFDSNSFENAHMLSIIAYEGWVRSNHTMEDYLATQFMIVEAVGGVIRSTSFSAYPTYKANIQSRINTHTVRPSFNNTELTLKVGESITLTDTNGVFDQFNFVSSDGLSVVKNGNSLTITATADANDNANVVYNKIPVNCVGTSIAFRKAGSQKVAKFFLKDPLIMNIKVKVLKYVDTTLIKKDSETGSKPQGDGSLLGAEFSLFNSKNELVETKATDLNGRVSFYKMMVNDTFYIKETKAPEGYQINEEIFYIDPAKLLSDGIVGNDLQYTLNVGENIITGDFQITKAVAVNDESAILNAEKDAQFIAVLKKYVDQYGSIEEAYQHKAEYSLREYDVLTTNENGIAISKKLAYGQYVVKQTKTGNDNLAMLKEPFEVNIATLHQPTITYVITNQSFTSYLRIVKKDADTGKTITLSNASFKIFDVDNNRYVSQRIGENRLDTWTTDASGSVMLPLKLPAGHYRLDEITAPDGYLINKDGVLFEIKATNVAIVDDEGQAISIVEMKDKKPSGTIKLLKTDKVSGELLSGVQYRLTAMKDIVDPADGSIIYKRGAPISIDIGEDGYYITNELGEIELSGLPLGVYAWEETRALDGYVKDNHVYAFELLQTNKTQVIYTHTSKFKNQKTITEILKTNSDHDGLAGASLVLYDSGGNQVDSWLSSDKGHKISGLHVDETYTLKELKAPNGYMLSDDVSFTIKNTEKVQRIEMMDAYINKKIRLHKVDEVHKKHILNKDFTFTVYKDKECTDVLYSMNGDKDTGTVEFDLHYGNWYIKETKAPDGYQLSNQVIRVRIDESGVWLNDELVEEHDGIFEFTFENKRIETPRTGDDSEYASIYSLFGIGVISLLYMVRIRNKQKNL